MKGAAYRDEKEFGGGGGGGGVYNQSTHGITARTGSPCGLE